MECYRDMQQKGEYELYSTPYSLVSQIDSGILVSLYSSTRMQWLDEVNPRAMPDLV